MKAIDAYRDLTKELDKYESPTFTIRDFNYFFGKGVSLWLEDNYKRFDVLMKDVDDLRSLYKVDESVTVNQTTKSGTLPADYRHMLDLRLTVQFSEKVGLYNVGDTDVVRPLRLKSAQKGYRMERNAYHRPSYKRHYYEIHGSTILFHLDNSVLAPTNAAGNLKIDYIREPDAVYLNPDKSVDYNLLANNTLLFYNTGTVPNGIYYEIINVVKMLFLENIESRRAVEATRQAAIQ